MNLIIPYVSSSSLRTEASTSNCPLTPLRLVSIVSNTQSCCFDTILQIYTSGIFFFNKQYFILIFLSGPNGNPLCYTAPTAVSGTIQSYFPGAVTDINSGSFSPGKHIDTLFNLRYCEVITVWSKAKLSNLYAEVYSTFGLNQCDSIEWGILNSNFSVVKDNYRLANITRNGPRYWTFDSLDVPVSNLTGPVTSFGGASNLQLKRQATSNRTARLQQWTSS
jgi:hypothetical protein